MGTSTKTPELLGAQHEPRGAIATQTSDQPTMSDYVHEWQRLGYHDIVQNFYERIDLNTIQMLIENSFISIPRQQALYRLMGRRYKELYDAVYT